MHKLLAIIVFLLTISFTATGQILAKEEQCAPLIDSKCTTCHYKSRICKKLGKKNKRKWKRTIKNMLRHGATISKDEQKTLLECLVKAPQGAEYICKE